MRIGKLYDRVRIFDSANRARIAGTRLLCVALARYDILCVNTCNELSRKILCVHLSLILVYVHLFSKHILVVVSFAGIRNIHEARPGDGASFPGPIRA